MGMLQKAVGGVMVGAGEALVENGKALRESKRAKLREGAAMARTEAGIAGRAVEGKAARKQQQEQFETVQEGVTGERTATAEFRKLTETGRQAKAAADADYRTWQKENEGASAAATAAQRKSILDLRIKEVANTEAERARKATKEGTLTDAQSHAIAKGLSTTKDDEGVETVDRRVYNTVIKSLKEGKPMKEPARALVRGEKGAKVGDLRMAANGQEVEWDGKGWRPTGN